MADYTSDARPSPGAKGKRFTPPVRIGKRKPPRVSTDMGHDEMHRGKSKPPVKSRAVAAHAKAKPPSVGKPRGTTIEHRSMTIKSRIVERSGPTGTTQAGRIDRGLHARPIGKGPGHPTGQARATSRGRGPARPAAPVRQAAAKPMPMGAMKKTPMPHRPIRPGPGKAV